MHLPRLFASNHIVLHRIRLKSIGDCIKLGHDMIGQEQALTSFLSKNNNNILSASFLHWNNEQASKQKYYNINNNDNNPL